MIWNRCCTRYNVLCTCHKLDLDSWIPSPTAGCTLIPWSQVTLIRTSQVSSWIVQLAPISWRTNLPGPFCVQDMVHLATGMIVGLHVISEGAILTNYLMNPWSPREKGNVFLGNRPPRLLDLDFHLTFFVPVFFIIFQAKPLDLCTGQELGWEVHSMKGHRSHFCIKYSTRGGVLLHPLHSTLALLSNRTMVIML